MGIESIPLPLSTTTTTQHKRRSGSSTLSYLTPFNHNLNSTLITASPATSADQCSSSKMMGIKLPDPPLSSTTTAAAMAAMATLRDGGRSSSSSSMSASRIMLALAAGTTLAGTIGFTALAGLLDSSDDLEDESKSDAIQVVVILARVWLLSSAIAGVLAIRAIIQSHIPSLRLFAIHAIIDTVLGSITVLLFTIATIFSSGDVSSSLGHAVCEHLSRNDAWGLVSSPGSGLELCEDRWNYGTAPLLLISSAIALFLRCKSAIFIYSYYHQMVVASQKGRISLEDLESDSPHPTSMHHHNLLHQQHHSNTSNSSLSSAATATGSSHHHNHHHHQHHQKHPHHSHHNDSCSSSTRPRTNTASTSSSSSKHSHSHSRSSSSSTVRPFRSATTASRIMLLPADYNNKNTSGISPALHVTPPSPCMPPSNSSSESLDTIKAGPLSSSPPTPSFYSSSSSLLSRKRAMSHDSASNPYNHVIVYAPVLMSIEEAQQLGGREAVIAPSANSSALCSSPTSYASTSPRLRGHSPPVGSDNNNHHHHLYSKSGHPQQQHSMRQFYTHPQHYHHPSHNHHQHQQHWNSDEKRDLHVPLQPTLSRSDSTGSSTTIVPADHTPVITMNNNPFGAIKGYRDSTEMNELASTPKNV